MSDDVGAGYLLVPTETVQSILETGVLLTKDSDALRNAVHQAERGINSVYTELAHRLVASVAPYLARALEGEGL